MSVKDSKGKALKEGDTILIRAKVWAVSEDGQTVKASVGGIDKENGGESVNVTMPGRLVEKEA